MQSFFIFLTTVFLSMATLAVPPMKIISGKNLLTGEELVLRSEGKKGLVVVFLSATCPCSHSHIDELRDLSQVYKEFNFVVIHSNVDEGKGVSQPYFQKNHFPFPVLEDEKSALADQLQSYKTPHAYVFGPKGQPLYVGGVSSSRDAKKADRKYLREALEDIQADQPVRTPEARTLGCTISRGEKNVW